MTRMVWPMGSSSPKSWFFTVRPSRATWPPRWFSSPLNSRPVSMSHSRASKKLFSTPKILVPQLVPPNTTCAPPRKVGAATWTGAISFSMALESSSLRAADWPLPKRTPPWVTLPGRITRRLAPSDLIRPTTSSRAPPPIETVAMTAATPMTMPSMVRMERSLWALSASKAEPRESESLMPQSPASALAPVPPVLLPHRAALASCQR